MGDRHFGKRPFDLQLVDQNGHFAMTIFNKAMIGTRLLARIGKKEALLRQVEKREMTDLFGTHELWCLSYESPEDDGKKFTGIIKVYKEFTIFEVINHFEIKGKKNKHLFGNPYLSFPSFEGDDWDRHCSCLSFKRQAPFNYPEQWNGKAIDSLRDGKNSPLVITNQAYETTILSPLNHMLYGTVSTNHFPPSIRCGIPRALKNMPIDTTYKTIMVYGVGVNKTIDRWGELLRTFHHTPMIEKDADVHLKYISYWTNAGSAYWYNVHKKTTYEKTLRILKAHHEAIGLSFGSYQLDSWWYKKEGDNYTSGIREWEPKKVTRSKNFNSMLPFIQKYKDLDLFETDRLSYVQSFMKKPIGCHFKQLANDSVYVRGAEEDYIIEDFPIPKNMVVAKELFRTIFNHPKWRLSYVIHDWLQFMNDRHSAFKDIQVGSDYFKALDQVCLETEATDNNCGHVSLQFCMTQPHMTLNSVTMASVTSIRSTSDSDSFFVEGTKRWWWQLYSSRFIGALGKYPFYDNRKTYKSHKHPYSAYSKFEMIWLGLLCGPIGIGDEIGKENVSLIRRTVKADGEIIKPDVPAKPLDQCYLENPHKGTSTRGVTVYSHSDVEFSGIQLDYKVLYFLTFNAHPYGRKVAMEFSINEALELGEGHKSYVMYDYFSGKISVVAKYQINHFVLKRRKFFYHIAAPIMNDFAMIGDVSKHVTCSNQLIEQVEFRKDAIEIVVSQSNRQGMSTYVCYIKDKPSAVLLDGLETTFQWKECQLRIDLMNNPSEGPRHIIITK